MKNLKNRFAIFTFVLVFLLSFKCDAQAFDNNHIVLDSCNLTELEIPVDMKSKEFNLNNITTISKYVKRFKGNLTVTFDLDGYIVSAFVPKSISSNVLTIALNSKSTRGSLKACSKDCRGDGYSNMNAEICYYICLVEMLTE